MMQIANRTLVRALKSGTVAGLGVMATAALAGKRETGSWAAPLNATSHVLWGDAAAQVDKATLKHTVPGIAISHLSAVFWAAVYERFFGRHAALRRHNSLFKPLVGSAAVTAGAYLTDYYLVPRRLTPGYEKRLSGKSLAAIFGVLALGMAARDLVGAARVRYRYR